MDYNKHIAKHFNRLSSNCYSFESLFNDNDCLLNENLGYNAMYSNLCHYNLTKRKGDFLEKFDKNISTLFTKDFNQVKLTSDQIVKNCGEMLFALCEYQIAFNSAIAQDLSKKVWQFANEQKVDFNNFSQLENCFIGLNGYVSYYFLNGDNQAKDFALRIIDCFFKAYETKDYGNALVKPYLYGLNAVILFSQATQDQERLQRAILFFTNYISNAMTLTYSAKKTFDNVVKVCDSESTILSFIISLRLYFATKQEVYLSLARRIWFNGLQFCFRFNGSVGNDSTVTKMGEFLKLKTLEDKRATLAYATALYFYKNNEKLFDESDQNIFKDSFGRFFMGDKMFAKDKSEFFNNDLIEIPPLSAFDEQTNNQLLLQVIF